MALETLKYGKGLVFLILEGVFENLSISWWNKFIIGGLLGFRKPQNRTKPQEKSEKPKNQKFKASCSYS